MNLTRTDDPTRDRKTYVLEIDGGELMCLSPTDRAVLRSCEEGGTIADTLLGLELIARRIQESAA